MDEVKQSASSYASFICFLYKETMSFFLSGERRKTKITNRTKLTRVTRPWIDFPRDNFVCHIMCFDIHFLYNVIQVLCRTSEKLNKNFWTKYPNDEMVSFN